MADNKGDALKFIKNNPGADIFAIDSKLSKDIVQTKKALIGLEMDRKIISGLQKERSGSKVFKRIYFCSPGA